MTTNSPQIRPIERSTVVDAITERLLDGILSGSLRAGERLPPERELAAQLGVNRLTLRAALSRLEALALIDTHHGTGSVVRDYRSSAGIETFVDLVRVCRERDPALFRQFARDIFEIRRAVAVEAVALAAERRTDEDLVAIRAAVAAQQNRLDDVVAFARGDFEVARSVVRATRNVALELLFNSILRIPETDEGLLRVMYPSPRAQYQHYEVVVGLVESGMGREVRELMRHALEDLDRVTLARLDRQMDREAAPPAARKRHRTTKGSP